MNVLFLGEITGRCGIGTIKMGLKALRSELDVDFVVANGEGATGGFGLGYSNAQSMFHMGVDVFTMGEKSFFKLDMVQGIQSDDRILRPANYPEAVPGRGMRFYNVKGTKVCVINTLGMMGFNTPHLANPFLNAQNMVLKAMEQTPYVFYVFHAQASAEKCAMGHFLDGRASTVVGTHCKALSADGTILSKGTAYITDTGRCGSIMSVGGFAPDNEIKKLRTQLPVRSAESWADPELQGFLCNIGPDGKAQEVTTIRKKVDVPELSKS